MEEIATRLWPYALLRHSICVAARRIAKKDPLLFDSTMETMMRRKAFVLLATAGMFAAPLAVSAQDASSSVMQPGSNPPGAISPGAPSDAASGADIATGAYERTNPSGRWSRAGAGGTTDERPRVDRDGRTRVDPNGRTVVDDNGQPVVVDAYGRRIR